MTYSFVAMLVILAFTGRSQTFNDQGLSGGTGLVFLPSTGVIPSSQFRIQMGRLDFLRSDVRSANVFSLSGGLSSHLEAYLMMQSEQTGAKLPANSYGVGAKLQLPVGISPLDRIALWTESVSSPLGEEGTLLRPNIIRGGVVTNISLSRIQPIFFLGISRCRRDVAPLLGTGITVTLSEMFKIGSEITYGYQATKEYQGMITGMVRIIPTIGLQVSTGYRTAPPRWLLSAGIVITTSAIDFMPKINETAKSIIPSFEDMEKEPPDEKGKSENTDSTGKINQQVPRDSRR